MEEVLFINEEFYKKNISHRQAQDTSQVVSTIRLVQKTNLKSIVSDPVYDYFQTQLLASATLTEPELKLFQSIQMFLAVKVAEEMVYAAPRAEENEKGGSHLSYRSKASLMEARIVRDINRDSALLALAQSGTEEFDDTEFDNQGGFYFG